MAGVQVHGVHVHGVGRLAPDVPQPYHTLKISHPGQPAVCITSCLRCNYTFELHVRIRPCILCWSDIQNNLSLGWGRLCHQTCFFVPLLGRHDSINNAGLISDNSINNTVFYRIPWLHVQWSLQVLQQCILGYTAKIASAGGSCNCMHTTTEAA